MMKVPRVCLAFIYSLYAMGVRCIMLPWLLVCFVFLRAENQCWPERYGYDESAHSQRLHRDYFTTCLTTARLGCRGNRPALFFNLFYPQSIALFWPPQQKEIKMSVRPSHCTLRWKQNKSETILLPGIIFTQAFCQMSAPAQSRQSYRSLLSVHFFVFINRKHNIFHLNTWVVDINVQDGLIFFFHRLESVTTSSPKHVIFPH